MLLVLVHILGKVVHIGGEERDKRQRESLQVSKIVMPTA